MDPGIIAAHKKNYQFIVKWQVTHFIKTEFCTIIKIQQRLWMVISPWYHIIYSKGCAWSKSTAKLYAFRRMHRKCYFIRRQLLSKNQGNGLNRVTNLPTKMQRLEVTIHLEVKQETIPDPDRQYDMPVQDQHQTKVWGRYMETNGPDLYNTMGLSKIHAETPKISCSQVRHRRPHLLFVLL